MSHAWRIHFNWALASWALAGLLGLAQLSTLFVVWLWFFDTNPALAFANNPMPTSQQIYAPGDSVYMTQSLCRWTDTPSKVSVTIYGERAIINLPERSIPGRKGCRTNNNILAAQLPDYLPTGEYYVRAVVTIQVNPLAARQSEWYTVPFQVVR